MLGWLWLSVAVVVIDQGTKWLAVKMLFSQPPVVIIPGFFDLTLIYNTGAAFGFLRNAGGWQNAFFIVVATIVSMFLISMLRRLNPRDLQSAVAFSLILGGAIGNVIDRVNQGYVVDFIHWFYRDWHWPAFNIADSAITIGAVLLVLEVFGIRLLRARTT
jgi:signal peptidase II